MATFAMGADVPEEDRQRIRKKFEGMMRALHQEHGATFRIEIMADKPIQDFIDTHADVLDASFGNVKMSEAMRQRLSRSNWIFSGMKTFHELNEAFPSLINEDGSRKPFERFLNDVQKIDETYNRNYLHSEYNYVHASADMAAKWEQFMEDGDRYLLQYRTAHDDRVRPEHAELEGVTLPIDDSFWASYYPPNGWNCRCTVVQVRRGKYETTPHDEAMTRGEAALQRDTRGIFRFNSGQQKKSVPDYNPYTISRCRTCPVAKGETPSDPSTPLSLSRPSIPVNELCAACKLIHQSQATRTKKRLTPDEFKDATAKALLWAENNLDSTIYNGKPFKRTTLKSADGHEIHVGKKFFKETAAKGKRDPELAHLLKTATEFQEWLPKATYDREEDGIDHDFKFSVYKVNYRGQNIEFKCKLTQGEILYTMRLLK